MAYQNLRIIALTLVFFLIAAAVGLWYAAQRRSGAAARAAPGVSASVEADLFSGRPNPTWSLAPDALGSLQDDLARLPLQPNPAAPFAGLGYRGLIVRLTGEPQHNTMTVYVYHGTIRVERDGVTTVYADRTRAVERALVRSSKQYVPADIYALLVSATEGAP